MQNTWTIRDTGYAYWLDQGTKHRVLQSFSGILELYYKYARNILYRLEKIPDFQGHNQIWNIYKDMVAVASYGGTSAEEKSEMPAAAAPYVTVIQR